MEEIADSFDSTELKKKIVLERSNMITIQDQS